MAIAEPFEPNKAWDATYLLLDVDGEVADLTGTSLRMHVRPCPDSDTLHAEASTDNGQIEFVPNITEENLSGVEKTGTGIKILLTAEQTLAIYRGSTDATADLEITYPDGVVESKIMELKFEPDILNTRDFNISDE